MPLYHFSPPAPAPGWRGFGFLFLSRCLFRTKLSSSPHSFSRSASPPLSSPQGTFWIARLFSLSQLSPRHALYSVFSCLYLPPVSCLQYFPCICGSSCFTKYSLPQTAFLILHSYYLIQYTQIQGKKQRFPKIFARMFYLLFRFSLKSVFVIRSCLSISCFFPSIARFSHASASRIPPHSSISPSWTAYPPTRTVPRSFVIISVLSIRLRRRS